ERVAQLDVGQMETGGAVEIHGPGRYRGTGVDAERSGVVGRGRCGGARLGRGGSRAEGGEGDRPRGGELAGELPLLGPRSLQLLRALMRHVCGRGTRVATGGYEPTTSRLHAPRGTSVLGCRDRERKTASQALLVQPSL